MNWSIKTVIPEHTTCDGILVERQEKEYEIPFKYFEDVYYVHRKKWWKHNSPFVITKSKVNSVWATNMVGITLTDNTHIAEDDFDLVFVDKETAIECCIKKNEHRKVKIYEV